MEKIKHTNTKATEAEINDFISKVVVDVDSPKDETALEVFKHSIKNYVTNMQEQIDILKQTLPFHQEVMQFLSKTVKKAVYTPKLIMDEVDARKNLIEGTKVSIAVMQERIKLADEVEKWAIDNFVMLTKADVFFKGALNLESSKEYIQEVVNGNKQG